MRRNSEMCISRPEGLLLHAGPSGPAICKRVSRQISCRDNGRGDRYESDWSGADRARSGGPAVRRLQLRETRQDHRHRSDSGDEDRDEDDSAAADRRRGGAYRRGVSGRRASANVGAPSPAADRPCGSWSARISFTISSALFGFGGNAIDEAPSGVTRRPHRTSSAPKVSPPPKPGISSSEPGRTRPSVTASTRPTGTVAALMLPYFCTVTMTRSIGMPAYLATD